MFATKRSWWACLLLLGILVPLNSLSANPRLKTNQSKTTAKKPRIAAVVTEYRHNSHADVIVSRFFQTSTLDGKGTYPDLELVSLFTDQVPEHDTSRKLAAEANVPVFDTVEEALTLGTDDLAVDGILFVAEHGQYGRSETGQVIYPKLRLFKEIEKLFRKTGKVVPVFHDKHIADNWEDSDYIYSVIQELKIPYMAGSSLPGLWRRPAFDTKRNQKIKEVVATSYGSLDAYGFHALEMVQCLIDRRAGGETGVKSVQCLENEAVWKAADEGKFDNELLRAALGRLTKTSVPTDAELRKNARNPVLFIVNFNDGLKASILTLNSALHEWTVAWRDAEDDSVTSTVFWTQEQRPFMHFNILLNDASKMFHTRKPTWNVERTLLVSGTLDALLQSKVAGGKVIETPYLNVTYQPHWQWKEPTPPPPGRPVMSQ